MGVLKRMVAHLPDSWQQPVRRAHFRWQIRRNRFGRDIPEYDLLQSLVRPGDWVIDVGANVGHYTKRLSDLVAEEGRVLALEPVRDTFAILASNVGLFSLSNVSLLNVAASDGAGLAHIEIPNFQSGLRNYYRAAITPAGAGLTVVTQRLDALELPHRVALIKVDAEGHDVQVLNGAEGLLRRDAPALLVEEIGPDGEAFLARLGYRATALEGTANTLYRNPQPAIATPFA